ncbi:MAG: 3-methyl-2-oxobutanoate dehydrogenase subunit VorB [Spirochaetota bacterium]
MGKKMLMKGNEAIAEAAIRAGCRLFFGYPITPQNEIPEYMSRELPARGGVFLQAESEIAAINMVYGAAGAGARVMTSSSGPGIALKGEGVSYIACAQLPCVIVDITRGGPGLGNISPAQSDYLHVVKGMAHGDFHNIVLAPASVQEAADLVAEAFDLADRYRNPVVLMADGMIGQMMEPVRFTGRGGGTPPPKPWATTGSRNAEDGKRRTVYAVAINPEDLEAINLEMQAKYERIQRDEVRCELFHTDGAELLFVAYGTTSRIVRNVVRSLREEGVRAGLLRPITLWPFPLEKIRELAELRHVRAFLTVEMCLGQMVEDVERAVGCRKPVRFFGKTAGVMPQPADIAQRARSLLGR